MNYLSAYWQRVREHYARNRAAIMKPHEAWMWGIDFYAWDFEAHIRMTPIEAAIWHDIRAEGAVMYPQYPVAGHFVDYGNPIARVAIECDGAQFHTDKAADAKRQARIEEEGWTVYRITGRDCIKTDSHTEDRDGHQIIELNPARLLIREIAQQHNLSQPRNG